MLPAFAQKRHSVSPEAAAAQAYVPADQKLATVDRYTVVVDDHIVGRDPDPNERAMIRRDPMPDGP